MMKKYLHKYKNTYYININNYLTNNIITFRNLEEKIYDLSYDLPSKKNTKKILKILKIVVILLRIMN